MSGNKISNIFDESINTISKSKNLEESIQQVIDKIIHCFENGNKIIVFGMNGKLESKYNFKSTYKVYTEVNPFIEKEMEIK